MTEATTSRLEDLIRDVPDFPKPGIVFKDIMPLLSDGDAYREVISSIEAWATPRKPDVIPARGARGFLIGAPLATSMGVGFIGARKPGKLPYTTISAKYALEYGFDSLEVHVDAISEGQKVLIVDDLLATGGTSKAKIELVERLGGEVVGLAFMIELAFLDGRDMLEGYDICSLITY